MPESTFRYQTYYTLLIYFENALNHLDKYLNNHFSWQEGYGAFSYSKSQKENVIKYVLNQKDHHQKHSFKNEYIDFLKKYEIEFKNDYLFEFFE